MRHYWRYEHHDAWAWIFPGITMVLLWLVLITILVVLWRTWSHRTGAAAPWRGPGTAVPHGGAAAPDQRPGPEQVLAERLARGEIDIDDYRQRLAVLRSGPDPGPGPGAQPPQVR